MTYHDYIQSPTGKPEHLEIFHCVPYEYITWHAAIYNRRSIAVAIEYDPKEDLQPEWRLMKLLTDHLKNLCIDFGLHPNRIRGHRELRGTGFWWIRGHKVLRKTCPGMKVKMGGVRKSVTLKIQESLGVEADGIWGPVTQRAFDGTRRKIRSCG